MRRGGLLWRDTSFSSVSPTTATLLVSPLVSSPLREKGREEGREGERERGREGGREGGLGVSILSYYYCALG